MNNIEQFNQITASILKLLYENFPKPLFVHTSELREAFGIEEKDWWQDRIGTNPIGITIRWLAAEGFVRYSDDSKGLSFAGLVLTSKGLAALHKVPEALSPRTTIGERLKELSKDASAETVKHLVTLALSFAN